MSERGVSVVVIRGGRGPEFAEAVLARAASEWTPRAERRLYYPYYWYLFRYHVRTFLGTSAMPVSCLVDARTGLGATSEPFTRERLDVRDDDVLPPRLGEVEARRIAERYCGYVVGRRRKALVATEVEVIKHAVVHKPFWVVTCARERETAFQMLVDGITGGFHPLASRSRALPRSSAETCS